MKMWTVSIRDQTARSNLDLHYPQKLLSCSRLSAKYMQEEGIKKPKFNRENY